MAKRKKKNPDAHDRATVAATGTGGTRSVVYVDTTLQTHLLIHVCDSDTVTDFRKRLVREHLKCFPAFGKIRIHALKVMRSGCFYHLAESMPVITAFQGHKKFWFLSADASSSMGQQSSFQSLGLDPTPNGKGVLVLHHPNIESADDHAKSGVALGMDVDSKEQDYESEIAEMFYQESLKLRPCEKRPRLEAHGAAAGAVQVQPSNLGKLTENESALAICDGSNEAALGAGIVTTPSNEENPLLEQPQKIEPHQVPAAAGIDTNGTVIKEPDLETID